MDLTRRQSVLEVLEEDDFFISSRSPKRDHVNAFAGFQVHDRNGNPIQQTQGDETLLAIGKTIVFIGRRGPFEYAPGIGEVKPVIPEICLSLALVPREAHLRNVYTSAGPVKCSASQVGYPSVKRRSSYGSSHLRIVDRYAGFDVLERSR
jgi:hypothetical protein